MFFTPCKGIWIPGCRKFLLMESEILGFGIRNTAQGIRNLSSTDKDWNPVPGIRNPRYGIQNPRLSSSNHYCQINGLTVDEAAQDAPSSYFFSGVLFLGKTAAQQIKLTVQQTCVLRVMVNCISYA